MKDRFCFLQPPQPLIPSPTHQVPVHSAFAAYYYPWISVVSNGVSVTIPPGGYVAGVYARTDAQHGVHSAPSGTGAALTGVTGVSANINTAEGELLNPRGINVIRSFPGQGIMVWGVRTTSQDHEWLYVPVRRFLIFVEQSLQAGLQGAAFEPNGPDLWMSIRATIDSFLRSQWAAGAFSGASPDLAFSIRCDHTTMTQSDIDAGRVIVQVGLSPLRPPLVKLGLAAPQPNELIRLKITVQLQPQP